MITLIRKKDFDKKSELILKAINDTEYPIEYASGCTGRPMYIGEYLVDYVLFLDENNPLPKDVIRNQFNLSKEDVDNIISEFREKPSLWKK